MAEDLFTQHHAFYLDIAFHNLLFDKGSVLRDIVLLRQPLRKSIMAVVLGRPFASAQTDTRMAN